MSSFFGAGAGAGGACRPTAMRSGTSVENSMLDEGCPDDTPGGQNLGGGRERDARRLAEKCSKGAARREENGKSQCFCELRRSMSGGQSGGAELSAPGETPGASEGVEYCYAS